jgi:hypothetical protein
MMLDPFVDGRNGVAGVGGPAFGFAAERESVPEEIARDSIVCCDALQIPLRGRIFYGKPEVHFSGECSNRDYSRSFRKRMRRGAMKPE